MGGKGGSAPPEEDYTGIMSAMSQMAQMQGMMASQQALPQMPEQAPLPEIDSAGNVDWTDKHAQLRQKAAADYGSANAARKGRADTILTSPILDDDDDEVLASSILGGS